MEEDTVSEQCIFVDRMQKAFTDWESKQKEMEQRHPWQYLKNSKRTQRRHRKAVKEIKKTYKADIHSLLLKAGVCHVIEQKWDTTHLASGTQNKAKP